MITRSKISKQKISAIRDLRSEKRVQFQEDSNRKKRNEIFQSNSKEVIQFSNSSQKKINSEQEELFFDKDNISELNSSQNSILEQESTKKKKKRRIFNQTEKNFLNYLFLHNLN